MMTASPRRMERYMEALEQPNVPLYSSLNCSSNFEKEHLEENEPDLGLKKSF